MAQVISAKEQFSALLEMRSRLFWRSMRGADSKTTFVFMLLGRGLVLLVGLGIAAGAGFATCLGLRPDLMDEMSNKAVDHSSLYTALWLVFVVWQIFVLLRASLSHNVGRELLRFPISFPTYIALWTLSGITDYATMVGAMACLGIAIGAEFAGTPLVFALGIPLIYFLLNMLLSRVIFVYLERLLAHRRTRELVLIVLSFAGILPQAFRMYGGKKHMHLPGWLQTIFGYFPPNFAAKALLLESALHTRLLASAVLLAIGMVLAGLLFYRLLQEYRGEDLHESVSGPAAVTERKVRTYTGNRAESKSISLAVFENEIAKMKHSGMATYQMFAPLLFILIFGVRLAHSAPGWLLPGGLAYLSLTLTQAYNSLGTDGPGFQIYRMAPVSLREVYIGKNLFAIVVFLLQVMVLFGIGFYLHAAQPFAVLFALAFAVFAIAAHLTTANIVSLKLAKRMDNIGATLKSARMSTRRSNVGGWRGLIIMLGVPAVGAGVMALHLWLGVLWVGPLLMVALAVATALLYFQRLKHVDEFKEEDMERALANLTKAS